MVFPSGQRFHALWRTDFGLKLAFSGAKYASDVIRVCMSSYEIRSKEVVKNNKCSWIPHSRLSPCCLCSITDNSLKKLSAMSHVTHPTNPSTH
ncbi:hypothetical protein Pnap_1573 [Polaromonas naphthalenivorans CJ2]|uniref:Uncharacterized protein n=1 Tax=Polaromonas naphthalenivorans (strain CJ2) TaxID=365044 RepID=A1VMK9_POLNA|nr:hypothetical protein Pnap_1573 [Polaromonas naphthalenivorans CJ2]